MTKLTAWYPLHKDTKDWSGNSNNLTKFDSGNQITSGLGVVGKCLEILNANKTSYLVSGAGGLTGDHAMFCFLNVTELGNSVSANGVISVHNHGNNSGTGISLKGLSSTRYSISVNTGHKTERTYHSYYGSTSLNLNEWHHVGFTWKESTRTLTIYVDGRVDYQSIGVIPPMHMLQSTAIHLFAWSTSNVTSPSYRPAQKIQDVRIYNDIPSLKEISDISKGCFFNLPMNKQAFGSVANYSAWSAYYKYAKVIETRSGYVKAEMISDGTLALVPTNVSLTNKAVRVSGYAFRNGEPINVTSLSTYVSGYIYRNNPQTGWFCFEMQMTGSWIIHHSAGLDFPKLGDIYEFKSLTVEVLSEPTGNNGLLRDSSGFKNDLVATENLPLFSQTESNLGAGCYFFDNDSIYSKEPVLAGGSNQITMAAWFKGNTVGYDSYHPILCLDGTKYELNITESGQVRAGFHIDAVRIVDNYGSGLLDNNWHFIVVTYNGEKISVYADAELLGEKLIQGSLDVTTQYIHLGQLYKPKGRYSAKNLYISHAQLYGTALSSDDIKKLHRQRLTVDKNGSIKAYELTEKTGNTRISKRGELVSSLLVENLFKPSLLDYSEWILGSTSAPSFSRNGGASENLIIADKNPKGFDDVVWQSQKVDTVSGADGGWNTAKFPVDKTKAYRFTCWFKRKVAGNGSFYFGTHGYTSTGAVALETLGGTQNSNPYFFSGTPPVMGEWFLVVAYVYPSGTTEHLHNDHGIYLVDGRKIVSETTGYRWSDDAIQGNARSYLYYSTNITTVQQFYRPRVDLVDGTEPSLKTLIGCREHPPIIHSYGKNNAYSDKDHSLGRHVVARNLTEI